MLCETLPRLEATNIPAVCGTTSPTPTSLPLCAGAGGPPPAGVHRHQPQHRPARRAGPHSEERRASGQRQRLRQLDHVQRLPPAATNPNDMDKTPDRALCDENLRWLQAVLAQTEPTMWAAWGTLIEKRDYLPGLMREMVALTREKNIPWVTFGPRTQKRATPTIPSTCARTPRRSLSM